jgi:hypothetical protein
VSPQASFFVLYILLEVPSQYFLKKIGPRYYLSGLLFGCGVGKSCPLAFDEEITLTIPIVDVRFDDNIQSWRAERRFKVRLVSS